VNHFHAAGGIAFLLRTLLEAGLLHEDVVTVAGRGLERYLSEPYLDTNGALRLREGAAASLDNDVLRAVNDPFDSSGGIKVLRGNLGRAIIKVSAVKPQHRSIEAPARVFADQDDVVAAFKAGELERDVVVVVTRQGPRANGMPELHKLTPPLGVLQDKGYRVALVTDGRMSGASGKVPAAIHVTPEAVAGGPLALLRDGDIVRLDGGMGCLEALVAPETLAARASATATERDAMGYGCGRELFAAFRARVGSAESGATVLT
jgi:phosphogluconate dehydratase